MKKICPKCNVEFECKADDIENCDCSKINLEKESLIKIEKMYDGCLCGECLNIICTITKK